MDFFDIFNIKRTFNINVDELEKEYFKQMQKSEDQAIVNEAFITIKDDLKRAIYLLEINHCELTNPSSDFLHNVFNAFNSPSKESLEINLTLRRQIITDLKNAFEQNDYKAASIKTSELKYIYNLIAYIKTHAVA